MDSIHEQLVKTEKSKKYIAINAAVYVCGVLGLLMVGGAMFFVPGILLLVIAVGLFFLKKKFYVEYEYYLTNGEIDIDAIYEMKTRKRIISFSVRDLELLAPEQSYYVKDFPNKPKGVLNLYPEDSKEKVYVAMLTGGARKTMIRFVPNEEMLELCYKYNPRAVKKNA
jgi:hypothetical protein